MEWAGGRRRPWIALGAVVAISALAAAVLLLVRTANPGPLGVASSAPPTTASSTTTTGTTRLYVYFHRYPPVDPNEVVAIGRSVPKTAMVATAALTELLAGPTPEERRAGYWSVFTASTAKSLKSVRVAAGVAYVDFSDFTAAVPNAGSSFTGTALLAELDATVGQFATVESAVYSFDGDVPAFYHWLQREPPAGEPGDPAAAIAAGRRFLLDVVGMRAVDQGSFRWTGNGLGEASFHPLAPNSAERTTVVALQRAGGTWSVAGTTASAIEVDAPRSGQAVSSPAFVAGRAHTFEGAVAVRVLVEKEGSATEIGGGVVTGGGDRLRAFRATIAFAEPAGGAGWVLFCESSAADGEIVLATAVRVRFADPLPSATVHG
jgi:hypothetical protein